MAATPLVKPDTDCVCEQCKKPFKAKPGTSGRFCQRSCWYAWYEGSKNKTCPICGNAFKGAAKTCSKECGYESRRRRTRDPNRVCENCGKPIGTDKKARVRFCSIACSNTIKNQNDSTTKELGHKYVDGSGYIRIKTENGWEMEHRVVMAQKIGRPLTRADSVHHKDGNRSNNSPENLELWVKRKDPAGARVKDMLNAFKAHEIYQSFSEPDQEKLNTLLHDVIYGIPKQ